MVNMIEEVRSRKMASDEPRPEPDERVELFRALSDPIRFEMVKMLVQEGELACTSLLDRFGVTKSTISYHVRVLRTAHLIRIRKEGTYYFYELEAAVLETRLPGFAAILRNEGAAGGTGAEA